MFLVAFKYFNQREFTKLNSIISKIKETLESINLEDYSSNHLEIGGICHLLIKLGYIDLAFDINNKFWDHECS